MADPLSITASVVGIIGPALHTTRLLLQDLQQLKDAPKTIKRLGEDVQSVDTALKLLQSIEEREWGLLGAGVAKQSETTISSSTQACNIFRADLQKWTRHSEDGKLAWLDRANVGFFRKDQVKAMSEQLQSCKLAINLIVGVATLYVAQFGFYIIEGRLTFLQVQLCPQYTYYGGDKENNFYKSGCSQRCYYHGG